MRRCCMDKFKNVALSLAVIAGVTGLLFGATQATWSETATSDDQQFNSGNLVFHLDGQRGADGGVIKHKFFEAQGMVPGSVEQAYVMVTNIGSTDIKFDLALVNPRFDDKDAPFLDNVLEFQVEQVVDTNKLVGTGLNAWLAQADKTLWVPYNGATGEWIDFEDGNTLRQWRINPASLANPMGSSIPLPTGQVAIYDVKVRIAKDASNHYQEREFTVDLLATATSVFEFDE